MQKKPYLDSGYFLNKLIEFLKDFLIVCNSKLLGLLRGKGFVLNRLFFYLSLEKVTLFSCIVRNVESLSETLEK